MTARPVLVDDHLLLRTLLDDEPKELRPRGAILTTTGLWYHRLCRAVAGPSVTGAMSHRLGDADASLATDVIRAVIDLPESIGIASLRSLGWPMAELVVVDGARLNLLSLEALAAAQYLGAEICLAAADHNLPLREAAKRRGVPVRVIRR